jgi:hypothetical protein
MMELTVQTANEGNGTVIPLDPPTHTVVEKAIDDEVRDDCRMNRAALLEQLEEYFTVCPTHWPEGAKIKDRFNNKMCAALMAVGSLAGDEDMVYECRILAEEASLGLELGNECGQMLIYGKLEHPRAIEQTLRNFEQYMTAGLCALEELKLKSGLSGKVRETIMIALETACVAFKFGLLAGTSENKPKTMSAGA